MDGYENLKLQDFSHLIKSQFLKKVTHVVLSVSLLTIFFPHSLPWHSFFHSFSYCFLTLPVQLITHTIDKNCIFILCNGILVLVIKFPGLISSSKSGKCDEDHNSLQLKPVTLDMKEALPEAIVEVIDSASDTDVQVEDKFIDVKEPINDEGNEVLVSETYEEEENDARDKEDEDDEQESKVEVEEEDYQADTDGDDHDDNYDVKFAGQNAGLSTDELNKKFDEFIRRMKEELRISAQQHLVMV